MPELFPSNNLKILEQNKTDSVELNRLQIACLIAHMFFCTFLPSPEMRYVSDFFVWLKLKQLKQLNNLFLV